MIFFQFCGRRLSLCLFACLESEYELGFLMVRMMSPEDAQNMRTCHNETLIHMNWRKTLVCDNNGIFRRDDPTALLRMAQYAQFVVLILNVPIGAQISLVFVSVHPRVRVFLVFGPCGPCKAKKVQERSTGSARH